MPHISIEIKRESMKKLILLSCGLLLAQVGRAQSNFGDVVGTVVDSKSKAPIFGAEVYIEDQAQKYRIKTDYEGRFRLSAVPSGEYLMNIKYFEDTMKNIPVTVSVDGLYQTGTITFDSKIQMVDGGVVRAGDRIRITDGFLPVPEMTYKEIGVSAIKFNPAQMAATMSPGVQMTDDGDLVFKGARKGDMIYMVDGMKSNGVVPLPSASIKVMKVYSGGLPAKYGDTMGGAVVVETMSYFDLYRDWVGQQIRAGKM